MTCVTRWMGLACALAALHAGAADSWQHVTTPLLPSDEIQLIKVVDKGVVWIGTSVGAVKVEGGVVSLLNPTKDMMVWDVTPRPEGGLWVGHSKGALLVDGERTVPAIGGYNVPSIRRVDGRLWAIAKNESTDRNTLMQADGEEWAPVEVFKDRNVLDLVRDGKGMFWVVLDGDGVYEFDPAKSVNESQQHLPRMNVTSILTDSTGRTWLGLMSDGLMMRENGEWERQLDGETSAVLSLAEDGHGAVWAATSGNGVWRFDGTAWTGMLQEEGAVNLLKATSDKRIWVSTQRTGGLRNWNGTDWENSLDTPMPILNLIELPNGVLMAGSLFDGVYVLGDYSIKGE